MLPKGKVGEFSVGGKKVPIYINMNTAARFDELSERSLNSLIGKVWGLSSAKRSDNGTAGTGSADLSIDEVLQVVNWPSIRALASAALHRYDRNLEPEYLFTPGQLGAMLEFEEWSELLQILFKGLGDFMVRDADLPRSLRKEAEPEEQADPSSTRTVGREESSTGGTSTGLDVGILDSLEKTSEEKPSAVSTFGGSPGKSAKSDKISEPVTSSTLSPEAR
jgi:hypothetical protein